MFLSISYGPWALLLKLFEMFDLLDLRCDIREGMLEWLADHQPEAFAQFRIVTPVGETHSALLDRPD